MRTFSVSNTEKETRLTKLAPEATSTATQTINISQEPNFLFNVGLMDTAFASYATFCQFESVQNQLFLSFLYSFVIPFIII